METIGIENRERKEKHMNQVVYVFNEKDKDILVKNGFTLWKEDIENEMYILVSDGKTTFSLSEVDCYQTDVLPF